MATLTTECRVTVHTVDISEQDADAIADAILSEWRGAAPVGQDTTPKNN